MGQTNKKGIKPARYLEELSIKYQGVDELIIDIRDMARRNPTAFILGSVVVGIGISRFFKASAERRQQIRSGETQTRDRQYNDPDPSFGDYE